MTGGELIEYFRARQAVKVEWLCYKYSGESDICIRYFTVDQQVYIHPYTYFIYPGIERQGLSQEAETIYWTVSKLCPDWGIFTLDLNSGEVRQIASVWYDFERQVYDNKHLNFKRYLQVTWLPEDEQSSQIIN